MSISDTRTVDFIGVDERSGECVLTISDHLEWNDGEHLMTLQEKINSYLAFIESGEIEDTYPKSKDRRIRIDVVVLYEPDEMGLKFLEAASSIVRDAGFSLNWTRASK